MKLMLAKTYAEERGYPYSTIRSMCHTNILPSCKIGVRWFLDPLECDLFFENKVKSRKAAPKPERLPRPKVSGSFKERLKALRYG